MATHTTAFDGKDFRVFHVSFLLADVTYTFNHGIACPLNHAPVVFITPIGAAGVGSVVGAQVLGLVDETTIEVNAGGVVANEALVIALKPDCDVVG